MVPITISKKYVSDDDLVIIPKKKYRELIEYEKELKQRLAEEADTDEAITIYKREKKKNKLKIIKSLSDLD